MRSAELVTDFGDCTDCGPNLLQTRLWSRAALKPHALQLKSVEACFYTTCALLRCAGAPSPQVRLVVMSATLQAQLFGPYFWQQGDADDVPPPISVGARRFPVRGCIVFIFSRDPWIHL